MSDVSRPTSTVRILGKMPTVFFYTGYCLNQRARCTLFSLAMSTGRQATWTYFSRASCANCKCELASSLRYNDTHANLFISGTSLVISLIQ